MLLMTCCGSLTLRVKHGANANATEGWRGQTALMWAAAEGHSAVVPVLVAAGANLHARSSGGFTPLLFGARHGQIATVEALEPVLDVVSSVVPVVSVFQSIRPVAVSAAEVPVVSV